MPEGEVTQGPVIEKLRAERHIVPFISDYLPDQKDMPFDDRVAYYKMLKKDLGVHTVRTEFRMRHMINRDGTFDQETVDSYTSALRAMKEAGLSAPIVCLFSPAPWMVEQAKKDPKSFYEVFTEHAQKVKEIYTEAQFPPSYIQALNEVNIPFHTPLPIADVAACIKIAGEVFHSENGPSPKIMTTIAAGANITKNNWREYTTELVKLAGSDLDAIGFDYYPGSYVEPAIQLPDVVAGGRAALEAVVKGQGMRVAGEKFSKHKNMRSLRESKAFHAFGRTDPYEWIAKEKAQGMLRGKDIIIAETGVPAMSHESRFAQIGYDRIVQTLDHFLLGQERKGNKSNELFSAVGFFTGGEFPDVYTMVPGGVDFHPWTLVRRKDGAWTPTNAARRLKSLIETRLYPPKAVGLTITPSSP